MPSVRTDIANEVRQLSHETHIKGVRAQEETAGDIAITRVYIEDERGAHALGKPVGQYITLELQGDYAQLPLHRQAIEHIAAELRELIPEGDGPVLIIGLGNQQVTPDSLGPLVTQKLIVTRHLIEYLPDLVDERVQPLCAFAPGVLGVTGIETMEIVRGVVEKVRPRLVIAVDALASRDAAHIGMTVQISDTGIHPGSGIGNKREGLNQETLGVPVLALGIPMVVYASTIAHDAIGFLVDRSRSDGSNAPLVQWFDRSDPEQLEGTMRESMNDLVVTPKEIDIMVDRAAALLADGLNVALQPELSLDELHAMLG